MRHPLRFIPLAGLCLTLVACGSAVESQDDAHSDFSTSEQAPMDHATFGSYQLTYQSDSQETTLSALTNSAQIAQTLLLSREDAQTLSASVAMTDVTLSNWYSTDYDEGANQIRLLDATITNTNSAAKHYNNFVARFSVFTPSSVNMSTTPSSATCSGNSCTVSYTSIPYSGAAARQVYLNNPSGASLSLVLQFEADLTGTAPTNYVSNATGTLWPGSLITEVDINGLGFGTKPDVYVGGQKLTLDSFSDTFIALTVTSQPVVNGTLEVDNGGGKLIQGPYIRTTASGYATTKANTGDGNLGSNKLYALVWTGTGVPTNGCAPTSNLGSFDTETKLTWPLRDNVANLGVVMPYLDLTGTGIKSYLAYDKTKDGKIGNGDYFKYTTGNTFTANVTNTIMNASGTWSTITAVGDCP